MRTNLVVGAFTPSVLLAVARRTGRLAEHGLAVTEVAVPSSPARFRSLLDAALPGLPEDLAARYVTRLKRPAEGLITQDGVDASAGLLAPRVTAS